MLSSDKAFISILNNCFVNRVFIHEMMNFHGQSSVENIAVLLINIAISIYFPHLQVHLFKKSHTQLIKIILLV